MKTVVTMDREGRLTLPAEALEELRLSEETQLEVEIENGAFILKPKFIPPPEDAWAYTPEHLELVRRALEDEREGRVYRVSERDLDERATKCR